MSGGKWKQRISRRDMLRMVGIGGAGLLLGGLGANRLLGDSSPLSASSKGTAADVQQSVVPFYGEHQGGIATPPQDYLYFAAFDLTTTKLAEVRDLFKQWTEASAAMTAGEMIGQTNSHTNLPPSDTGESAGLLPSRMTITFGVGPSFFDGRFGLSGKKPANFTDLPPFSGDELRAEWSGGDIGVQVCANDLQVAFHAARNLARIARGKAVLRWTQEGFQRSGAADPSGSTPRNLMGFKDGTVNPDIHQEQEMNRWVWLQPEDGVPWLEKGSYMVVRRIRMRIEVWDRTTLGEQEATFGRHRDSGAPIGGKDEFDEVDLEAKDANGSPLIPVNSHVRLARFDGKTKLLRRSYSYSSGLDKTTGQLDAGLLFICFQRDIAKQFVAIQKNLATDRLNEYIVHVGSAVFACFPGTKKGGYIGETLF